MAGYIFVLIALGGAALYASIRLQRRFADMLPISMLCMILSVFVFGLFGWMHIGAYITLFAFAGLGILGLYHAFLRRSGWRVLVKNPDISLVLLLLCLIWIAYISAGRIPLQDDELTTWAFVPKTLFFNHGFSAMAEPGAQLMSTSLSMPVFQYCFQIGNQLFSGSGFTDWLLYAAYGAACVIMLVPWCKASHDKKAVRIGYTVLFFLVLFTFALDRFSVFSALPADGFVALLAAFGILTAPEKKTKLHAVFMGTPIAVLALSGIAGLLFAAGTAAVYTILLLKDRKRDALAAAAWLAAVRPFDSGVGIHLNSWEVFAGFWRRFAGTGLSQQFAVALPGGGTATFFSTAASWCALAVLYALVSAWLIRKAKRTGGEPAGTIGSVLKGSAVLSFAFVIGLCLYCMLVPAQDEAVQLPGLDSLFNVALGFFGVVLVVSLFKFRRQITQWTGRQHILIILVCVVMVFMHRGNFTSLTRRDFADDAQKQMSYYAVLDGAREIIPQDAWVYIVSQNDAGSRYYTLRYGLYPRRVNAANTWWLSDPDRLSSAVMYPVTLEQWREDYLAYDYVLLYATDAYFQQAMVTCFESKDTMKSGSIYRVDQASGLLIPME